MLASVAQVTQKMCQALESIRITVEAPTGPSILFDYAFLGGSAPHLREIELDGIAFPFPAIRRVLLSTKNLAELCDMKGGQNLLGASCSDEVTREWMSIFERSVVVKWKTALKKVAKRSACSGVSSHAISYETDKGCKK
jgi:hypothetical protein